MVNVEEVVLKLGFALLIFHVQDTTRRRAKEFKVADRQRGACHDCNSFKQRVYGKFTLFLKFILHFIRVFIASIWYSLIIISADICNICRCNLPQVVT